MRSDIAGIYSVDRMRQLAEQRLPTLVYDFVTGGAEDEVTLRENRRAFEQLALRPHVLAGIPERSQATTVFGHELSSPVILGPTGLPRLSGFDGDVAGARAAGRRGTIFTHSCMGAHTLEETAAAADGPLWFQLYLWRHEELTEQLARRAQAAGYSALVLTLDVPTGGKRERDLRNGFTIPPKLRATTAMDVLRHPRWLTRVAPHVKFANLSGPGMRPPGKTVTHAKYVDSLSNPGATFDDVRRLRDVWDGPLVAKGVLAADDAIRLIECGVDGIVVSNHGGRQLDGAPPTLSVLPEIVAAVDGRVPVFLDGGIRRGGDVVKALALGATAVLIARPWLWGLGGGGEAGIVRVLEILHEEIDRTLILIGRQSTAELDPSAVVDLHQLRLARVAPSLG